MLDCTFVIDETGASELTRFKSPWLTGECEWTDKMVKRAVVNLALKLNKPVLSLTNNDYNDNGLSDLLDVARVRKFWGAPNLATRPGLKAVELFEAVHRGEIRALWVLGTNPAVSLPDGNRVREALSRCELLVVSDLSNIEGRVLAFLAG